MKRPPKVYVYAKKYDSALVVNVLNYIPPGMWHCKDVSFKSHIGWDVPDHAETSSRRHNWYVNETDLFETSLRRLIGI